MKYQPGTRWNMDAKKNEEYEAYRAFVRQLLEDLKTDPHAGDDLMQRAGIWDENCQLTEKYRDPDPS